MTASADAAPRHETIAAVDLGSNSFHLAVARVDHGELRLLTSLSEKVQLAGGLDDKGRLAEEVQTRALDCLSRFAQHLNGVAPRDLRVVGTNALREARNAHSFVRKAEKLLAHPVEIIAGREEARLIYLGVAHTLADPGRRLVVDIGGGSTEFIIGERFDALATESLQFGCVGYTSRFFADGSISANALDRAVTAACQEIQAIEAAYRALGWQCAVGSSGTFKAVRNVLAQLGLAPDGLITASGLDELRRRVLKWKHVDEIDLPGLKDDRKPILPAGLACVLAIFEQLELDSLAVSEGALREGVLYDLIGRFHDADMRDRTVAAMMRRYHLDASQAERVANTALVLFDEVAGHWGEGAREARDLLARAARLHELGLSISHNGFHKHGAYILRHADMPGFGREEQARLALLVGSHRRKLREEQCQELGGEGGDSLLRLALLLRLAALLHHSRSHSPLPPLQLSLDQTQWRLAGPRGWLREQPLTRADLDEEAGWLAALGHQLLVE